MIIITGPGRSGTSVLAQFCLKMGYNPGGSWYDQVDAGMEHPRVAAINDSLFLEATRTGSVQKTLDEYREEMRSLDLTVVKDPRFTFHPEILRAWQSVRSDLKVLMTYRTPEHSIASRKRHARDLVHKDKAHPDVLRCDFANGIEAMLDLEIPFAIVLFPNFLQQYDHIYEAFETLGMHFEREAGREVWNTLVNMEKVHVGRAATARAEEAKALKPLRNAPGKPWERLPQMSIGLRPSLAAAFLICLIFTPLIWKNLSAAAGPLGQDAQIQQGAGRRLGAVAMARSSRHWATGASFDNALLRELSAYSIHRLPFETSFPGRSLRRRGIRQMGRPTG